MYKTSQTEKLTSMLQNIFAELTENNSNKNFEERVNKIRKAFCSIETQMNLYVSKFSFDENTKNLQNDETHTDIKTEKVEEFNGNLIRNSSETSENEEMFSFLSLLGKKDIEYRKKEFEEILGFIENEFDLEILEKIEESLSRKKAKKNEFNLEKAKEEFNGTSKENFGYQKYISVKKVKFCGENFFKANKKEIPENTKFPEDEVKEDFALNNYQLNKETTKTKLFEVEKKIRDYLITFQRESFFKKKIFTDFVEEENNLILTTRKNVNQNPSIIKSFFEEEAILTAKKRHSVAGEEMKNKLEKMNQNRNCVSNKNEDEFILKQKALARKRSNISDFSVSTLERNNNNSSSGENSSEEDNDDVDVNDFGNVKNNRGSILSGNATPKLRLSKRGSILRERISKRH